MKRFHAAHNVLTKILNESISFSLAMRLEFKSDKNKTINRHDVSALVGCSLRHHLIFNKLAKEQYPEISIDQFAYFSLALSNYLFVKVLEIEKANKELERLSSLQGLTSYIKSLNPKELIPEEDKKDEDLYLSYRYNTPLWLVKMWKKHYKDDVYYRLLRSNSKAPSKFYMAKDEYDFSNGFIKSKVEGVYKKVSKDKIDISNLLIANPVYKYAIDQLDIDTIRGLLIYSEVSSPIINHLYGKINKFSHLDYLAGTQAAFFEGKKQIENLALSGAAIYECPSSAIITAVANPVHTVIVLPNNSNYSQLRERPDYFLNIKQEDLDGFIENELKTLQNAANFVEDGGSLLYLVDTISKKESYNLINSFVKEHEEFIVKEQKQFLPCNSLGTSCYFAILEKKGPSRD